MEQTLGKRIVAHRKRLGMTQDRLAECLGVTAQAVSKWENDQSCPDITMLPKLAELFGISTDTLLGVEAPKQEMVHHAEVVTEEEYEPEGIHIDNGAWEFKWDAGRKSSIGIAVWVLLVGGLLLTSNLLHWDAGFWDIAWPAGLLLFGLGGLWPNFSFFRLGCCFFGGYFLLSNLNFAPFQMGKELLLPILLLLFGLSLLFEAMRKGKRPHFTVSHNGKTVCSKDGSAPKSTCTIDGESFLCSTCFGENHREIRMPRLSSGDISVSFGELTVDLSGCENFAPGCNVETNCSFGQLTLLVPRRCRVEPDSSTAFGAVEIKGTPAPDADAVISLACSASFGEIRIQYI